VEIQTAVFVGACGKPEELFGDGSPEVVFAGRSNVGKSSLLNRLVGGDRARTSSTPGRTQTINWFRVDGRWWLVDLPGYGYAKASKDARRAWAQLIGSYFDDQRSGPRLVVQLVDARVGATPLDIEAGEFFDGLGVARQVVATKVDRLKRSERASSLDGIVRALELRTDSELLAVSAKSGEGIRELWKRISDFLAG
jgi:GTP-binding protein